MKKTTSRDLQRSWAEIVGNLKPGESIQVTAQGKPFLKLTKEGGPRRRVPNASADLAKHTYDTKTGDALLSALLHDSLR